MKKRTKILLTIGLFIVIGFFAFSLFKNISYPLLWNDEASTAMFGKRVIEYGYPKANDGKNFLYLFNDVNHDVGVRNGGDVYIAEGWTQYYLAAIGEFFAKQTDNIYTKTSRMRTPFALAGFLATIIFGLTISSFFKENRWEALLIFFLFELASISLVLHLREVRYYSLVLLFSAVLINVYLKYVISKTLSYKYYLGIISLFIVLLFHTHYPIALVFLVTFGLHIIVNSYLVCEKKLAVFTHNFLKLASPLFISLIFIIPSLFYFKTFIMVKMLTAESVLDFNNYFNNIGVALSFFTRFEFLYLAILVKSILLIFLSLKKNIVALEDKVILRVSNFLTLFFGIYILVIARTVFVFERYLIALQPVLVGIILLDILLCWLIISKTLVKDSQKKKKTLQIFTSFVLLGIFLNVIPQIGSIKNHFYELTHQYQGPLDFAIPYIQEEYKDPTKIIIATNYEENSYMYYLGSKTIIGYVGNNLEEDSKLEPDVIVLRKYFIYDQKFTDIFNSFFDNQEYQKVSFPIYDYPFNNIPELNFNVSHLYKTKIATQDSEKLDLFFRK